MLDFYLLIPCYNNTEGLIRSLLSVEYPKEKYKVLVVDDGSNIPVSMDAFPEELLQKQIIEIIRLPENKGITRALNTGLEFILEKNDALYTARLDCGDICYPDRFYKQINFLSVNTDISLIGSICLFREKNGERSFVYSAKEYHKDIVREMHLKCSFIHPTTIYRNCILQHTNLYPYNYPHAEDYAFFFELVRNFKSHILQDILLEYEIDTEGISVKNRQLQIKSKINIIKSFGFIKSLIYIGLIKHYFLALLPYKFIALLKRIAFHIKK